MRRMLLSSMWLTALTCQAQSASIELGGLEIRRGMARVDVVTGLESPYQLAACSRTQTADGEFEDCRITDYGSWESGGEITFVDDVVWSVSRNLARTDDPAAYEILMLLSRLVQEATESDYVCATIGSFRPQEHFPQAQTLLVLPDRVIVLNAASRGEGHRGISIQESVRFNPVADGVKVHKSTRDSAQCVLADLDSRLPDSEQQ